MADGLWTVTLDVYQVPVMIGKAIIPLSFARAVAPFFITGDGLSLSVSRANPFTGVARLFGMQDIEVGDPAFDRAFVVKGSRTAQTVDLFAGEDGKDLRETLLGLTDITLGVSDDLRYSHAFGAAGGEDVPPEKDVVYAVTTVSEGGELIALHALLEKALLGLHRVGAALPSGSR